MVNNQTNEFVVYKFIENDKIDESKLYLENGTLVIENYGDAYSHEHNHHEASIEGISKLKTLNRLVLSRFNLEKFVSSNPIPEHITGLNLINCRFHDLTCVSNLAQLESFTLTILALDSYQFVFKNSDYAPFHSLKTLGLSGVFLKEIPVISLENLEKLILINNKIQKIENLAHFNKLKELHLQYNEIKRIDGLENLTHLRRLYLYNNRFEAFEGLDTLKSLKYLDLNYNLFFEVDEYQMPLREALEHFGHLKKLIMLNDKLYPENNFYPFFRLRKEMNI